MYSMLLRMVKRTWPSAYRSPISQSFRRVKTSRIRWVPARTVQISSPLSAMWQSTPTLGWVWYFHCPKFRIIAGCMYWNPSGHPDSIGIRCFLAMAWRPHLIPCFVIDYDAGASSWRLDSAGICRCSRACAQPRSGLEP